VPTNEPPPTGCCADATPSVPIKIAVVHKYLNIGCSLFLVWVETPELRQLFTF
jgi:hypothetical protein